jgi:hypothetical protein
VPESQQPSDDTRTDDAATKLDRPDPAQEFGKAAAEDAELAERLTNEAGGDLERAASEFDDAARGPVRTETAHPRDSE